MIKKTENAKYIATKLHPNFKKSVIIFNMLKINFRNSLRSSINSKVQIILSLTLSRCFTKKS